MGQALLSCAFEEYRREGGGEAEIQETEAETPAQTGKQLWFVESFSISCSQTLRIARVAEFHQPSAEMKTRDREMQTISSRETRRGVRARPSRLIRCLHRDRFISVRNLALSTPFRAWDEGWTSRQYSKHPLYGSGTCRATMPALCRTPALLGIARILVLAYCVAVVRTDFTGTIAGNRHCATGTAEEFIIYL